ncbi:hypothetical protein JOM56_005453 [Amanita muscaria]
MVTYAFSVTYMFYAKINDPVLGPPGVRILLTFRGLAGYVRPPIFLCASTTVHRYIGISGSYYSLQYLPLADAVALTFLTPICTAILGTLILKEKFGIKEASGASTSFANLLFTSDCFVTTVISLIGATLIARPPFIFGTIERRSEMGLSGSKVTPHQRIVAVGFAFLFV